MDEKGRRHATRFQPANGQLRSSSSDRILVLIIAGALACYLVAAVFHLPQHGTALVVAGHLHEQPAQPGTPGDAMHPAPPEATPSRPPYWMVAPFAALLAAIAVLPLVPAAMHWWESNLHRFYVAAGLGAATLAYYVYIGQTGEALDHAILKEYIPFIVLLFSLYTISGGIRIEGELPAHPLVNCAFLAVGAILASFIGTTGAAMLLIRPLLETNRQRKQVKHTVIFFIFVVCNCGGLLLPLGDPPLFLGYLMGVPFLWPAILWKEWLFVNAALLAIYFFWDRYWCYPRETPMDIARDETRVHRLRFGGVWPNAALLVGVVLSIALLSPSRPLPGTDWHPWLYLREAAQLGLVALSLGLGASHARRLNRFNYAPIVEVAVLFFGIFVCMQPALQILDVEGPNLGLSAPWHYFWAAGSLSSVLDNAPTYVVFFETARSLSQQQGLGPAVAGVAERLLIAISLGAVLMGANTYIGNGPNFMVKAIAERSGVAMPGFFGYMLYSALVLVPLFLLVTFLFL
jgi:Na+/H+ antiporter NhaD/arsenite permease-like protein